MTGTPENHVDCAQYLKEQSLAFGTEITVSTAPPLVDGPYENASFVCPHGTTFWIAPTGEQIAAWARDGAA